MSQSAKNLFLLDINQLWEKTHREEDTRNGFDGQRDPNKDRRSGGQTRPTFECPKDAKAAICTRQIDQSAESCTLEAVISSNVDRTGSSVAPSRIERVEKSYHKGQTLQSFGSSRALKPSPSIAAQCRNSQLSCSAFRRVKIRRRVKSM